MIPRRTVVVWAALIGSMTICAGLLFWLEPRPAGPANANLTLSAVDGPRSAEPALFRTAQPLDADHWRQIVIHHSGQDSGNAGSISRLHDALGYGSLGYHFVIGNGHGSPDGQIQIGPRWSQQADGVYASNAISICLVGNGDRTPPTQAQIDQLVRLIESLQQRLGLGADQVVLHGQIAQTSSPGRHFPAAEVKLRLLGLGGE